MTDFKSTPAVAVQRPAEGTPATPLLLDSPHSGSVYPDDFVSLLPRQRLRRAEDAFVDDLFSEAPGLGVTLIDAKFPRSYLDPNRDKTDFSPDDLADGFSGELKPGKKAKNGTGLVWVRMHGLTDVYENKITSADLKHRIETCWAPYHRAVSSAFDDIHQSFGCVYHLNCHSMRSVGNVKDPDGPNPRPDFVLSDRDGTTCEPGYTDAARTYLESRGFTVQVNFPMKGVELVKRYSDPAQNRHSLQIEMNRRHYMDEEKIERSENFDRFKAEVTALVAELAAYARSRM